MGRYIVFGALLVYIASSWATNAWGAEKVIHLYLDADRSNHARSARSIEQGILTALDEINHRIQGYRIHLKTQNHRGNVRRSLHNNKKFLKDENALVMFGGMHSPPLIKNREFINKNKILTLVPWAAGGPITRYPSPENWIFRVSVDDTRAGYKIVDYAIHQQQCQFPHLLLENTAWGSSNFRTMSNALEKHDHTDPKVTRFGLSLQEDSANIILRRIIKNNHDCILLVANAIEGTVIAKAMLRLPTHQRLPIISHWGITGGNLHEDIPSAQRSGIRLHFLQTCFSFLSENSDPHKHQVLERSKRLFSDEIVHAHDIKAPVGFIHAYDATKLLIAAINQVSLTDDMPYNRTIIRKALEELQSPVIGLVKTYTQPFTAFDEASTPNAHEAIGPNHYCMGRFGPDDSIIVDTGRQL